jgi:hypothetical protein
VIPEPTVQSPILCRKDLSVSSGERGGKGERREGKEGKGRGRERRGRKGKE